MLKRDLLEIATGMFMEEIIYVVFALKGRDEVSRQCE